MNMKKRPLEGTVEDERLQTRTVPPNQQAGSELEEVRLERESVYRKDMRDEKEVIGGNSS